MTTLVIPPGVPSDGYVKVAFVPAMANIDTPSVAEIGAAGSVDLSCYLTRDGFQPDAEESTQAEERLCSKEVFETFGPTKWTIQDLTYVYDVQNDASVSNKAYKTLVPGTQGYLVVRWGKDAEIDWTVADKVDVYPVELGQRRKQAPESNSTLKVKQRPNVIGDRAEDVALVA